MDKRERVAEALSEAHRLYGRSFYLMADAAIAALEPVTVQEAARVLLDAIDDGEVWRVYMNAMTPILRADMSADGWNTVDEIRAAFASALRALAEKDT
jgi:hypothetical protein